LLGSVKYNIPFGKALKWSDGGTTITLAPMVTKGIAEVTCFADRYDKEIIDLAQSRGLVSLRGLVNLYSFTAGEPFTVTLDEVEGPSGVRETILHQDDYLVVRFQHSHPVSARSVANVGIIRTTSKYRFLVEFMDLTFATSLPLTPDANVKSTPLVALNTAIDLSNLAEVSAFVIEEPSTLIAMNDAIMALQQPFYVPIGCGRAVDGIRQAFAAPGRNLKQEWAAMQAALRIRRAYQQHVTDASAKPRHAESQSFTPAEIREILSRTWTIINRYLEYRKRGNSLPASEFPELL